MGVSPPPRPCLPLPSAPSAHLDLPIVTNGLDGDRALHKVLRVPGPELHDGFGASHQAGDGALGLDELLLLVLAERRRKDGLLEPGERRRLPGISAPPPQRCPAGVSRVEQTQQEDPAALTGWDEGAGDGMGGRTDGGSGWDLSATAPTALQSRMHTPLALVLLGQESILFQKEKEKRTQHTAKLKSQEV